MYAQAHTPTHPQVQGEEETNHTNATNDEKKFIQNTE